MHCRCFLPGDTDVTPILTYYEFYSLATGRRALRFSKSKFTQIFTLYNTLYNEYPDKSSWARINCLSSTSQRYVAIDIDIKINIKQSKTIFSLACLPTDHPKQQDEPATGMEETKVKQRTRARSGGYPKEIVARRKKEKEG